MFGYVTANKTEMSDQQIDAYKGYYCGLCQMLKKRGGQKAQLLLNYDITFLSMLLAGLYEPQEEKSLFTCPVHPTKKRTATESEITTYCADMDILLSYYNLMDDYFDEGKKNHKKLADYILPSIDRIRTQYPRQTKAVEEALKLIDEAEHRKEENLSIISDYCGHMLGEIFVYDENDVWKDDLRQMGYYLGKFVYIMDAFCDLDDDIKKNNFNPLKDIRDKDCKCFETYMRQLLTTQMAECTSRFEHMPILKNSDLIRNILYSGVWMKYDICQAKKVDCKKKKKSKAAKPEKQ